MNKDTSFRLLVVIVVALLGYIVWMNTRDLVELELQVDRLKGGIGETVAPPVPAAEQTVRGQSFEQTLEP